MVRQKYVGLLKDRKMKKAFTTSLRDSSNCAALQVTGGFGDSLLRPQSPKHVRLGRGGGAGHIMLTPSNQLPVTG
jgi:hypothetical protein